MARLTLVPRWFRRRLDIVDAAGHRVATIRHRRARADVTVKGATYVIEDRATNIAMAHHGRETAHASFAAPAETGSVSITVDCSGRLYDLERRAGPLLSAARFVARERGRIVGTVRRRAVDLPETVPLHIRVFMIWLVAHAPRQAVVPTPA